ncbi:MULTISPECIES: ABC transporter permease [Streptomyces]|uniref:ABC transporter permease n=2 Tax=Streptomyces TaxID=1883 RepID=A0ABN2VI48_9ACTN|nr:MULTISPECIES: ABC transporter permease [Streptomyces]QKV71703.1 ABC transporter permease [Streptomyces harbinensis]SFS36564.1 putative spermidine/putrescine transport system permease protein [Streptomyces harbinensis]
MIRSRRIALVLLLPGLVLLVAGVVIPALTMLLSPPRVSTGEVFDRLGRMLSDPYDLAIIWRTLRIGLTVTGLCLVLGFPTAYLLARSRSRWAGVLLALAIFPLLLSNVVRTYGWLVVLGRNGVVGQTIEGLGLADPAPQLLYTELAVVLGLTQLFLPLAIITCYSAVAQVDANLDEAARGLGAGRMRTLWSVTIPLSMPGIAMAATLVFAGAVTAYTTPYLLGGSRQTMLATQLFRYSGVSLDWAAASATALIMTVLVLVVYSLSTAITRAKAVSR